MAAATTDTTPRRPVKLGIVGYGNSAKVFHLPMVLRVPDVEVCAFMLRRPAPPNPSSDPDSKPKPGSHCAVDFPNVKHYTDLDSFLADPEIELVLVTTPVEHYEFARSALLAGKHVVVEKPFTTTSEQATDLIRIANEKGRLVTPYHNRRFDGDFLTVQKLIRENVLGDVLDFESNFDWDDPGWPSDLENVTEYTPGKGMLYELGSHTADQVLCLFGRPSSVFAVFKSFRDGSRGSAIDDWHLLVLQYRAEKEQGLVVTLRSTQLSTMTKQFRFLVRGRKGSYLKFGFDVQERQIWAQVPSFTLPSDIGVDDPAHHGVLTTRDVYDASFQEVRTSEMGGRRRHEGRIPTEKGNWTAYYEHVVRAVRGEEELYVKPEDGRDVVRLFELARESARTGQSVPWS